MLTRIHHFFHTSSHLQLELESGSKKRWLDVWMLIFVFAEITQATFSLYRHTTNRIDIALQMVPAGLVVGMLLFAKRTPTEEQSDRKIHLQIFSLFIAILMELIIHGFLGFGLIAAVIHTIFISLLVSESGRIKYMTAAIGTFALVAYFKPVNLEAYNRLLSFLIPSAVILFLNSSLGLFIHEIAARTRMLTSEIAQSLQAKDAIERKYEKLLAQHEAIQLKLEQSNHLINRFEYHLEQLMAERQLVEGALSKSEARFRKLVEDSSDVVLILDKEGYINYCSDSAQRTMIYTSSELLGRPLLDHIHPADIETFGEQFHYIATWEQLGQFTFRMENMYGQWVHFEAVASNMLDQPGIAGVVVNLRDITSRTITEKQLKLFESAVTNTTDAVMLIEGDSEPKIAYVNQAFTFIMGYTADEVIGQSPLILLDDTDKNKDDDPFIQALNTQTPIELEQVNLHKNGTLLWVSESWTPVFSPSGQFSHWVSIKRDISQRRELEEQFLQSQKMEAVGRLAGGIAHDFNNLLTVMLSYSDLMLRRPLDDKQRKYVGIIQDASQQAADLTQQLLSFSRKQYQECAVLRINDIIRDMKRMLERLIGENIDIKLNLQKGVHAIEANPNQLKQIIMNLVVNARDAMPDGGRITINTANFQMYDNYTKRLTQLPAGSYVAITIQDSGTGIHADILPHIFEPFFTTKADKKGTGLGLSTVYGIISSMGGDIQVHSAAESGTTFTIYLPISNNTPAVLDYTTANGYGIQARENETILLVEDNDQVRELAQDTLKESGYTVLAAVDGLQALAICESHSEPIDLLLTDVIMPDMNGRELAHTLIEKQPDISIIYMSGYTDTIVTQEDFTQNGAHFLAKPFTPSQLTLQIRESLEMRAYQVVHQ